MQQVGIDREGRFAALVLGDRDLMLLGELNQLGTRRQVPFAPGSDHLHVWLERVVAKLKSHLVVAFTGGAVRHRFGSDLLGDLDLLLGDQRPRDRGAEQVLALIDRVGSKHRKHVVAHELFTRSSINMFSGLIPSSKALARAGSSSSPWPRSAVNVTTS